MTNQFPEIELTGSGRAIYQDTVYNTRMEAEDKQARDNATNVLEHIVSRTVNFQDYQETIMDFLIETRNAAELVDALRAYHKI